VSKENVARFLDALTEQRDLNRAASQAEQTTAAWARVAGDAGFEFSPEELQAMLEALLGEQIEGSRIVGAFVAAQSELDDAELDRVAGGRGSSADMLQLSPATVQQLRSFGIGGAGDVAIVHHVKGSPPGGSNL